MFRNLIEKSKKNSIEKEITKIRISFAASISFLSKNLFILLFFNSTLCTNYIPMYVMKRPISTKMFQKIQHQNSNHNDLPRFQKWSKK